MKMMEVDIGMAASLWSNLLPKPLRTECLRVEVSACNEIPTGKQQADVCLQACAAGLSMTNLKAGGSFAGGILPRPSTAAVVQVEPNLSSPLDYRAELGHRGRRSPSDQSAPREWTGVAYWRRGYVHRCDGSSHDRGLGQGVPGISARCSDTNLATRRPPVESGKLARSHRHAVRHEGYCDASARAGCNSSSALIPA